MTIAREKLHSHIDEFNNWRKHHDHLACTLALKHKRFKILQLPEEYFAEANDWIRKNSKISSLYKQMAYRYYYNFLVHHRYRHVLERAETK